MALQLNPLFPAAVATEQLQLDPLVLAAHLQLLLSLPGGATGNPSEGCACTDDLNGVWQYTPSRLRAPGGAGGGEILGLF